MTQLDLTFRTTLRPDDPAQVRRIVGSTGFFRDDEIPVAVELVEETLARGAAAGYAFVFAEEPCGDRAEQSRDREEAVGAPHGTAPASANEPRFVQGNASLSNEGAPIVRGYACFGLIPCTLSSYDLYWIVVDNGCRGRGIGVELMRRVEAAVATQGGRRIYIETSTRELYAPTRRFYEKCGYAVVATFPDFYADGDGKAVFQKTLQAQA